MANHNRVVRRVSITEQPNYDGWLLRWSTEYAVKYPTAIDAQRAVADSDKAAVGHGTDVVITTIEWEPVSALGRAVLAAIVPQPKKVTRG